ncbi:MAG: DRTGG domain-containing protein [Thermoguttaceae bacterium]
MLRLADLVDTLRLDPRSGRQNLAREVTGGYASDLLSDVIAHARQGDVWITLQIHQNIVAVAAMKELAGIILVGGREPEPETVEKAETEKIPIMVSTLPAFEIIGRLYGLGLRGIRDEGGAGSPDN